MRGCSCNPSVTTKLRRSTPICSRSLSRAGRFEQAEPYLKRAYEDARTQGKTARYAGYATAYGWCLANMGRAADAVPLLLEANRVEIATNRPDRQTLWFQVTALIACYDKLSQPDQAALWRAKQAELGKVQIPSGIVATFPTEMAATTTTPSTNPAASIPSTRP
jgi:tetratricopeptide (TPR) repeat protein